MKPTLLLIGLLALAGCGKPRTRSEVKDNRVSVSLGNAVPATEKGCDAWVVNGEIQDSCAPAAIPILVPQIGTPSLPFIDCRDRDIRKLALIWVTRLDGDVVAFNYCEAADVIGDPRP